MNITEQILGHLKEGFNLETVQNYNPLYSKINGLNANTELQKENDIISNSKELTKICNKINENE